MSLALTPEQEALARTVRRFIDSSGGLAHARAATNDDYRAGDGLWRRLASELGLQGIAIDSAIGGAGAGYQELGLVFEELGRSLLPEPLFASLALALPILECSHDAGDILAGLAAGERTLAVAWCESDRGWSPRPVATSAVPVGDGWSLTGAKRFVIGGDVADTILVSAATDAGTGVFAASAERPEVHVVRRRSIDGTRSFADCEFDAAPARLVVAPGDGDVALGRALDVGAAMLSSETVGAARACFDMTVQYAKLRQQFGRPIGSFQAIKHKLAEGFVALEEATATAHLAAWAAANAPGELPVISHVAKYKATEAFFRIAGDAIQIHGGIGFTWEHDAHLFFKRAKQCQMLHGDGDDTLLAIADRLELSSPTHPRRGEIDHVVLDRTR